MHLMEALTTFYEASQQSVHPIRLLEDVGLLMQHFLTSYGHNVELAWLLLYALDVLGLDMKPYEDTVRKRWIMQ